MMMQAKLDDYLFIVMFFFVVPCVAFIISKKSNSDSLWDALPRWNSSTKIPDEAIFFKKIKIEQYSYRYGFKFFYFDGRIFIIPCFLFSLLGREPKKIKVKLLESVGDVTTFSGRLSDRKIHLKGYRR